MDHISEKIVFLKQQKAASMTKVQDMLKTMEPQKVRAVADTVRKLQDLGSRAQGSGLDTQIVHARQMQQTYAQLETLQQAINDAEFIEGASAYSELQNIPDFGQTPLANKLRIQIINAQQSFRDSLFGIFKSTIALTKYEIHLTHMDDIIPFTSLLQLLDQCNLIENMMPELIDVISELTNKIFSEYNVSVKSDEFRVHMEDDVQITQKYENFLRFVKFLNTNFREIFSNRLANVLQDALEQFTLDNIAEISKTENIRNQIITQLDQIQEFIGANTTKDYVVQAEMYSGKVAFDKILGDCRSLITNRNVQLVPGSLKYEEVQVPSVIVELVVKLRFILNREVSKSSILLVKDIVALFLLLRQDFTGTFDQFWVECNFLAEQLSVLVDRYPPRTADWISSFCTVLSHKSGEELRKGVAVQKQLLQQCIATAEPADLPHDLGRVVKHLISLDKEWKWLPKSKRSSLIGRLGSDLIDLLLALAADEDQISLGELMDLAGVFGGLQAVCETEQIASWRKVDIIRDLENPDAALVLGKELHDKLENKA